MEPHRRQSGSSSTAPHAADSVRCHPDMPGIGNAKVPMNARARAEPVSVFAWFRDALSGISRGCRACPAARRTQWVCAERLTGDCRYSLNFNELLGVAENGNSDERAGHVMHTESLAHHIPHCDEILARA